MSIGDAKAILLSCFFLCCQYSCILNKTYACIPKSASYYHTTPNIVEQEVPGFTD